MALLEMHDLHANLELALWESGEKHPPVQPALTRTCKFIRSLALPIYYQQNVFRAHYCYETDIFMAIKWLKGIGHANRLLMCDFALWDKVSKCFLSRLGDTMLT